MVSRLTRGEFTQALQDKKIDVSDAAQDPALRGLDVGRADLNHDGKISGASEAAALFREVDRFDRNGDAGSIATATASGAQTQAGAMAAALQARAVFDTNERPGLRDAALRAGFSSATLPVGQGARGDAVVAAQYALARLGYAVGRVDGQFGPGTGRALSAFQAAAGVAVTGTVDDATLAALDTKLASTDFRTPAEKSGDPLGYLSRAASALPRITVGDRSQPISWNHPEIRQAYGRFVASFWDTLKTNRVECDCKTLSLFFMDQFRAKVKTDTGVSLPRPGGLPDSRWQAATSQSSLGFFQRFERLPVVRPGYEAGQAIQRLDPQASMLMGTNLRYDGVDANMAGRAVRPTIPWSTARDNRGDSSRPELPASQLEPGDLIVIDHTGDGRNDHMANVVRVEKDAQGVVRRLVVATGSFDDMKDTRGDTAPRGLGEVNNYTEEVTIDLDATGRVTDSRVTWASEPSWLTDSRYSARTLLMELRPGGRIFAGKWG